MSGLILAASPDVGIECSAEALRFTPGSTCALFNVDGVQGAVTRVDAMDLWGPAYDPVTGVRIALGGRVALEREVWDAARTLPYSGGLACRATLAAWLERGDRIVDELNGAFCVVILDPRHRELHLITDRMGIYPLYRFEGPGGLRLCSHPDVLADLLEAEGHAREIDWTTVAEFLATGRSVHPYTYYGNIRQLDAGSHYVWRLDRPGETASRREYWHPAYRDHQPPHRVQDELVEELAAAWRYAVRLRTHEFLGKPGVFLSGGVDSRGMLFALDDPACAECVTFFDEPNAELATAGALAKAAEATHHRWQRDPEYYGRSAEETVRISGGMWSLMTGHYTGFLDRIHALELGTVMTGCYADYFFKGLSLNTRCARLLGRNLPLRRLATFEHKFYLSHQPLRPEWQAAVDYRLAEEVEGVDTQRYRDTALLIEERRLRPISREVSASGRIVLLRCTPWDWVFDDTRVLDVLGRLSVESKLNGLVFERAVVRLCGAKAARIRNNNYNTRLGAGEWDRAAQFIAGSLRRKVRKALGIRDIGLTPDSFATTGSWPNWTYYVANSVVLRDLWSSPKAAEREFFGDYLGYDPWSRPLDQWSENVFLFFQILTARLWLSQRRLP